MRQDLQDHQEKKCRLGMLHKLNCLNPSNIEKKFSRHLLQWRQSHNYDSLYPWRNSKNKYRILLSEILLKKTTRKQVSQEWKKIVSQCKNFEDIRRCNSRTLKKVLKPLGERTLRRRR